MKYWKFIILMLIVFSFTGCLRYLTHDREKVLLQNVDIDQTLKIAEMELKKHTWGCILGIWVIRDQILTAEQASKISDLYFSNIDSLKQSFNIWHLTWAISDAYRNGDESVRSVMQKAYDDARARAKKLGGAADKHVNGDKLYMGDAHSLGRRYAQLHIVVPGDKRYLQSFEEYLKKQKAK
jgi:hypothetical protein